MSQKMDRRREIAAQRAARSARFQKSPAKMRAEAQEYAAAQRAQAVKPAEKKANVLERTAETVFDVAVANPTDGLMEWIEGASIDLPLGIVGVVGGWINDDFGNTVRNVVAHDTWGALMGDRMQEWSAASYTNGNKAGEIVEEVANGLGGMLPTVLAGIFTGGASAGIQTGVTMGTTALGAAGKATQGAYQDGASREAGLGYGLVSGGIEAGTEKLLGGAGTLGKGLVKTGGKVAAQGGKRVLKSMAEEAGEEILAELADPIAKTIYKGSDALSEYGTSDYWLGLAEAGAVGGLTAGVYGGTLGHAVTKMRGANADIDASLDSIKELGDQQDYLFVKDKLDAKKYSTINANVKSNYNNVERVLKKASPETRARLIDTYKLHDAFDDSGNMRSEFAAQLDKKIAVGQIPTDGTQMQRNGFSPYVSPNLAANVEEIESDLALINEDLNVGADQRRVSIFDGELSEKAQKEYTNLKRAANNLNSVSGDNFNIAIVNAGADFNGVTVKGKNIYISAELLENGGWAPTLIHELTHFAEGSPEYNKFARFLLSSNPEAAARKASELTAEGNAYGFTRENVERDFGSEPQVQYSKENVIELDGDNELSNLVSDVHGSERYKTIAKYILTVLGNEQIKLSDGKMAIVDNRDAIHIANKSGAEKTAQISKIKEIVEKATLYAEDKNAVHGKFNYFCYYRASVKYDGETFPLYLNVGKGKNDGKYHIYDITKKIRDTADRINGLERPKPNEGYALENDISTNSISEESENVNTKLKNNSDSVRDGDFASELIASIAEDSVGTDGAFIDRLVRGNESLAARIINRIQSAVAALESRKSPEARAEYKRLKNAEKLFMRAVESTGKRYVDGKIVADDEDDKIKLQYSFTEYTDKQKDNWKNAKRIVIYENEQQFREFINTSKTKSDFSKKMYFGAVPSDLATLIRNKTGVNVQNFNCSISAYEIRKIFKDHSNESRETLRGQRAITEDDIVNIPLVIQSPESIKLSSKKYEGKPVIEFSKQINGTLVVAAVVSDKHLDLFVQTSYVGAKKGNLAMPIGEQAPINTPETSNGTVSNNSIPENSEEVNTKLQYSKKSSAQQVKNFANENREKVYSKKEIRAMLKNVSRDLLSFEGGDFGLVGQNQTKVVEKFFNAFNAAKDDGRRYAVCMELADYMLKHASMLNAELPSYTLELTERLNVLRRYIHKLDLDGIRGEIKHRYGKDNSPYLLWHKSGGMSPDAIVSELAEQGIIIEAENEADIFFEIEDLYKKYRQTLNEDMNVYLDDTLRFVTAEERRQKQEEIAKELLVSFDRYGSASKLARFTDEYERRINALKDYIHEIKDEAAIKNKAIYVANQIKQLKNGEFVKASDYRDDRFDGSIGKLANITYRGNLKRGEVIRETLGTLRGWYADHSNKLFHGDEGGYRDDISNMMYEISQGEGELSYAELQGLVKVLDYFKKMIETQDKIYKNGKWIEARPVAKDFDKRIRESRQIKSGFLHKLITGGYQQQFGDNASVMRAADLYDPDGFFTTTFTEFRKAAEAAELMKLELRAELEEFFHDKKNKKYIKRLTEKKVELYGEEITVGEAISVYMTHNREQAWSALCKSGFVVKDKKGKTHTFRGLVDEKTAKKLVDNDQMKVYINESKAKIRELLNNTDMEYISIIERAFAKCASIKEKIDVERLGYSNVLKNKYYYPIRRFDISKKVDDTDYYFEVESASHMSFNENTVKSSNRLSIEATDTVFNRHVNGIALYANFAIINENLNRVLNISTKDTAFEKSSLAMTIKEDKKAQEAWNFLQKIKDDISGLKVNDDKLFSDVMGFLRSGYAKAALAANPKVLATQLSSFVAAGSMLEYNSIIRGISMRVDKAEVDKYCKTALLRNAENTVVKAQTITDKTGKVSDALMAPIGMVDRSVVVKLFGACQVQVEKDKGLKLGTEENKKAAGELLSEVIFETQQNSLVTERSAAMRSQQEVMKSLVMFSADAMKLTGRFIDSVGEWHAVRARIKYLESESGKADNAAVIKTLEARKAELKAEIEKLKGEMEQEHDSKFLTEVDFEEYMNLGKTKHTRDKKQRMYESGKMPILTSSEETKNFINQAIHGNAMGEVRAFGKVGRRLSDAIKNKRDTLEVYGKYLELNADDLRESYKRHHIPKEPGDIKLSDADFENIAEDIFNFDYITAVNTHKGKTEVHIAKETKDGYVRIISVVSNERNSLQIVKMFGVSKDKFENRFGRKKERVSDNQRGQTEITEVSNAATPPLFSGTLSTNSISDFEANVNSIRENIFSLEAELRDVEASLEKNKNAKKELNERLTGAKKKLARSASAIVSSAVFMSVIALAFRYLYGRLDDKEPKEIALDVGVDLFGNMIGALPFFRDAYSLLLEGYEIDISSVSMLSDFLTSTKSCWALLVDAITGKEITSQKAYYTAKKVVTDTCHLFGVPLRNAYNATYGTLRLFHPSAAYTMDSWFYDKNYRADLKEALENDDDTMISTITGLMLKDGSTDYDAGAEKAITELLKEGYSVLPRSVGDTVTYNGETVSLTVTQRRMIQKTYHEADEEINKLSRLSAFKGVSSDIQAKAINFIYEMYWQRALAAAFGSTGKTKNELFTVGIDPYVLAIIVATARSMESDKDAKGKAISGSRLKKIEAYLESQRLIAAQKHMLLGYLGYKNAKGEDKVKTYISSLALTAQEKAALMEYSGYEIA